MKNLEDHILSSGLPEEALMEKVGQSMTKWILGKKNILKNGVVVVVGPGHNGGDGLVIARELFLAGINVFIWCPLPLKKTLTIKHFNYIKWLGVTELQIAPDPSGNELWIDALFGLGQSKPLPNYLADLFKTRERNQPKRLLSLDVPSGICSDSGICFKNGAATASFTLTVGLFKRGLIQDYAIPYVGTLVRFDIGIPSQMLIPFKKESTLRISSSDLDSYKWPKPSPVASKYARGRVLIIAGSEQYRGAAFLTMKGALASGAGSIQAALPRVLEDSFSQLLPEIVLAGSLENSSNKSSLIGDFINQHSFKRVDSLLIGPGLGLSEEDWEDISMPLRAFAGLLVLDADALNRLGDSERGWRWLIERSAPTLITPHISEFQRLFKDIDITDPLKAASEASLKTGVGIVLKGAHTVFAAPSGQLWQLGESAPWVARTGLGDVLAGFLAGFGSILLASSRKNLDWEMFAGALLIHSEAARTCPSASTASAIAAFLAEVVNKMNIDECYERDT